MPASRPLEVHRVDVAGASRPIGAALANIATAERDEVVVTSARPGGDGPMQTLGDGRFAFRARLPGLGLAPAVALATDERVVVTDRSMSNGLLAVAWDLDGNLRSVIDVARARDLLPSASWPRSSSWRSTSRCVTARWDLESWVRTEPERLTTAESVEVVGQSARRRSGPTDLRSVLGDTHLPDAGGVGSPGCPCRARLAPP